MQPSGTARAVQPLAGLLLPRCPAAPLSGGLACGGLGAGGAPVQPMLPGSVAAQARPGAEGGCTHFTGHRPPAGGSVLLGGIFCGHSLLSGALWTLGCAVNSFEALGRARSGVLGCAAGRCGSDPGDLRGLAGDGEVAGVRSGGRHGARAASPRLAFLAGTGLWPRHPPCGRVGGHSSDTLALPVAWGVWGGRARGPPAGAAVG